jgi:DNA-binding response OmpR family regulator
MNEGQVSANPSGASAVNAARPLRILVVDDDRDTVISLMMVLRDEGHDVRGTWNPADVTKAVEKFDPDAVLLDINLPGVSGYELARRIRARRNDKRPLLIAISGVYKKGSDRLLAQIAGFDHHVAKPYDIQHILELIAPLRLT